MNLLALTVEIIESKLLTRVSDVVDSPGQRDGLVSKLLSRGNPDVPLDIRGDREGRVKLMGVWFRILGLPKLLDVPGPEFVVLLWSHAHRVSSNFEPNMIESHYPRAQSLLIVGGVGGVVRILLWRCVGMGLSPPRLLFPLLLASLQLAVRDRLE